MRCPADVLSLDDAQAARQAEGQGIGGIIDALSLATTSNLMLVSDHGPALRAAKLAGAFSCHFHKRLPGAPRTLPADFRAEDLEGVQAAIEELNGVTIRDADTEIRSQFGVYQT